MKTVVYTEGGTRDESGPGLGILLQGFELPVYLHSDNYVCFIMQPTISCNVCGYL